MHLFCFLNVIRWLLRSGLDGGLKETTIISEIFWLGFGVNQIIDSLSFLFLRTHIRLNFHETCFNNKANNQNFYLSCFFFLKNGLITPKNVLNIIKIFASAHTHTHTHTHTLSLSLSLYLYLYLFFSSYNVWKPVWYPSLISRQPGCLAADEARVSHVLSHVVWWKKNLTHQKTF